MAAALADSALASGRISGLLCRFCADAELRSQWAKCSAIGDDATRHAVEGKWSRPMLKRTGLILLWLMALLLIFVSSNLNDPYLIMLRGRGVILLIGASFAGLGLLLFRGYWRRPGVAGKLLVMLWCLPPLAMASATTAFYWRKHSVLHAEGPEVRDLGRHFMTGYPSFDEVAALAAKGLISGVYISQHNIRGRAADALKSELSSLQAIRVAA